MQPDKNWAVEGARYQVKLFGDHESNPGGPIGCSWDQICPPWAFFCNNVIQDEIKR